MTTPNITIKEAKTLQLSEIARLKREVKNWKAKYNRKSIEVLDRDATIRDIKKGLSVFADNIDKKRPASELGEIVEKVSLDFGVPYDHIIGKCRESKIVEARHEAMYKCHQRGFSYSAIGRFFNCDHTSVKYAVEKVERI